MTKPFNTLRKKMLLPARKAAEEKTKELLETAKGMHKVGILDDKTYEKITKRHLGSAQNSAYKAR